MKPEPRRENFNPEAHVEDERPDWLAQVEGVLETLNQGVMIADDCKKIIFVNDVFTEMTDVPSEEMLGHTSAHFFPPEDLPQLERLIAQGESAGRNRFEFYLPRKDGGKVPVVVSARRIEDPDGREFAVVTSPTSPNKNAPKPTCAKPTSNSSCAPAKSRKSWSWLRASSKVSRPRA